MDHITITPLDKQLLKKLVERKNEMPLQLFMDVAN